MCFSLITVTNIHSIRKRTRNSRKKNGMWLKVQGSKDIEKELTIKVLGKRKRKVLKRRNCLIHRVKILILLLTEHASPEKHTLIFVSDDHEVGMPLTFLSKPSNKLNLFKKFKYIDSGIKLDNQKYNQKLPHFYVMTKCMTNNYFLLIKSINSAVTC